MSGQTRKTKSSNDSLSGWSPFQVGLGEWANMINIPLGEGFRAEVWTHGEIAFYSPDDDLPLFTLTPTDAPMLRTLADEIEGKHAEYAEYLREVENAGELAEEPDEEGQVEQPQQLTMSAGQELK